jgi:hypothetical protein
LKREEGGAGKGGKGGKGGEGGVIELKSMTGYYNTLYMVNDKGKSLPLGLKPFQTSKMNQDITKRGEVDKTRNAH